MKTKEVADVARLGMTAVAMRAWEDRFHGRIVALTVPRYGAWIRDEKTGEVRYTDCVWIERLEDSPLPPR